MQTSMLIDPKKSRIRLSKSTLHTMGNPDYIFLLVNPKNSRVAICPAKRGKASLCVHYNQKSAEFYSQRLIQELEKVFGKNMGNSFRAPGVIRGFGQVAEYRLSDALPIGVLKEVSELEQ